MLQRMKLKSLSEAVKKYHPDINKEAGSDEKFKEVKKRTKPCQMTKNVRITTNLGILILIRASAAEVLAAAISAVLVSMIFSQVFSAEAQDEEILTHRAKVPICSIR